MKTTPYTYHDSINIFTAAIVKVHYEKNEEVKKELAEKMKTETAPAFLKTMTTILTKNGGQYMVGKGVSLNWFKYLKP